MEELFIVFLLGLFGWYVGIGDFIKANHCANNRLAEAVKIQCTDPNTYAGCEAWVKRPTNYDAAFSSCKADKTWE